jgi:hypothetical protein
LQPRALAAWVVGADLAVERDGLLHPTSFALELAEALAPFA